MGNRSTSDIELIGEIRAGKQRAYRVLVDRYRDYVFTIACRVLGDKQEAEEATQDTFIKAYNGLTGFQGKAKFTTWLYRIALNTAISYKRKRKQSHESLKDFKFMEAGEISKMDLYRQAEQKKFLQLAMDTLLPDDVSVLTLFYFQELTLEEMSEITGITVNTLKVKLFRARKRLSDALCRILKQETISLL